MIRLEELRVPAGDFSLTVDDLVVTPGEYLIVLGPTGSGKTVLLEAIAGLRRPRAGRVLLAGRDVTALPPEARRVGLVYQDYALFPHLRVRDNIGFALARGERQRQVEKLAQLLGIEALLDRYPDGLSGGEQQRVALARALAPVPEVLLLDEPLSALDGPSRSELTVELRRIHRELATTVIHVTHDLDEAVALGDRMAILVDGALRQVGAVGEVISRPVDPEVANLVGVGNVLELAQPLLQGSPAGSAVKLRSGHLLTLDPASPATATAELVAIRAEEITIEVLDASGAGPLAGGDVAPGGDNLLDGVVTAVHLHAVYAAVEVEVAPVGQGCSQTLMVHILRPQVARLAVCPGVLVRLRIPAASVQLCGRSDDRFRPGEG
jgi:ABC-type Fe3+/spermidine/putrescine transport system ATPase subunit